MKPNYRLIEQLLKEGPMQSTPAGGWTSQAQRDPTTTDPFDIPQGSRTAFVGQQAGSAQQAISDNLNQLLNFVYSMIQNAPPQDTALIHAALQHLEAARNTLKGATVQGVASGPQDPLSGMG